MRTLGLSGLFLMSLVGCDASDVDTGEIGCERSPALTWDNFGRGKMEQFCNGCHSSIVPPTHRNGAPVGVDFDTYPGVLQHAERIDVRVWADDPAAAMPPGGGPTLEEMRQIREWIQCTVLPEREQWLEEQP